jgi:hypothetical protein
LSKRPNDVRANYFHPIPIITLAKFDCNNFNQQLNNHQFYLNNSTPPTLKT